MPPTIGGPGTGPRGLRPRRTPEDLAKLVSYLTNQEKAEITYDLVYFAARAVDESDTQSLGVFLDELEEMAEVCADPARRRALEEAVVREAAPAPAPPTEQRP
jgi:hypothetical protein